MNRTLKTIRNSSHQQNPEAAWGYLETEKPTNTISSFFFLLLTIQAISCFWQVSIAEHEPPPRWSTWRLSHTQGRPGQSHSFTSTVYGPEGLLVHTHSGTSPLNAIFPLPGEYLQSPVGQSVSQQLRNQKRLLSSITCSYRSWQTHECAAWWWHYNQEMGSLLCLRPADPFVTGDIRGCRVKWGVKTTLFCEVTHQLCWQDDGPVSPWNVAAAASLRDGILV